MKRAAFIFVIILSIACKKPYTPPAISSTNNYLVVEAAIANSTDSISIKLSRTVNISNNTTTNPVTGASVVIENDQNAVYSLTETSAGIYFSSGLIIDSTRKYRLRINTADNNHYLSDFVTTVNSPAVDSVTFAVQGSGLNIYSNTHDPKNSTRYYRWDYKETWIIHSNYFSYYKSNGDTVLERDIPADQVYECWRSDTSSTILLGTSANLTKDVIANNPITFVDAYTGKLGGRHSIVINQFAPSTNSYSILVRQYGLTNSAYAYWKNLQNSSQNLGGIFDSQPTEIKGNIHSVNNPSETVIGYVTAGKVATKRLFISNQQIPDGLALTTNPQCTIDTFLFAYYNGALSINQENQYFNYNKVAQYGGQLYVPISVIYNKVFGVVEGHSGSTVECVDCTLYGTNKQPNFWK